MMYRIIHRSIYRYDAPVSRAHNEVHLKPRDTARQQCMTNELVVEPLPTSWTERIDFFGNPVVSFAVDGPFEELTVTSTSTVSVTGGEPPPPSGPTWEQARDSLAEDLGPVTLAAREFCFDSPLVAVTPPVRAYAEVSFSNGRGLVAAVADLTGRIFRDFVYDPGFTTVTTPVDEVLGHRHGVCQDFAHLAIGCLRSMGLAVRYVSGYLETEPPSGGERLVGSDASHAWPSVFVPDWGWLDVDPTNNTVVGTGYVTTAWGRDYSDVSPLKGIVFGGGNSHTLEVSVDVTRSAALGSSSRDR